MRRLALAVFGALAFMLFLMNVPAFAQNGSISGTVIDQDSSEPLMYAVVMAFHADDGRWPVDQAFTDSDGAYELDVPYGDYLVSARKYGYFTEWWQEVPDRNDATPVTVSEDSNPDNIAFTLTSLSGEPGSIAGTVFEEGTENTIAGADIHLHRDGDYHFQRMVTSGDDGTYLFEDIPPGSYHLDCFKEGYLPADYPEPVTVNGDDITGIDFYLTPLVFGTIAGTVYDASTSEPLADARITARLGGPHPFVREATTGEDGTYLLDELPPGAYRVEAHKRDYVPQEYPDSVMVNGDDITGIDFDLNPIVIAGISGNVTDAVTGDPISGALVFAVGTDHQYRWRWDFTDENGDYMIELQSGEYNVEVWKMGYLRAETPEPIVVGDEIVTGVDFALTPINFGSIAGTVYNTDGDPIANALVEGRMVDGFSIIRQRTDEEGNYLIDHVFPGSYIMRAFARDYLPEVLDAPVVVDNGADVTGIDFHLQPFDSTFEGHISGVVTDENNDAPIENAMVVAIGQGFVPHHRNLVVRRAFTDETGYYNLDELPQMEFKLLCMADDYLAEFYNDKHSWFNADPVTPDADDINFALTPRETGLRTLSGRITQQGQLVDGAIAMAMQDGEVMAVSVSYPDGIYYLDNLAPGDYTLQVVGADEAEGSLEISVSDQDIYNADIALGPTSADETNPLPQSTELFSNYPNPFNASTNISFYVVNDGYVELSVYNLLGRKVTTLVSENLAAGTHTITWDGVDDKGNSVASGLYLYVLKTADQTLSNRMVLLK